MSRLYYLIAGFWCVALLALIAPAQSKTASKTTDSKDSYKTVRIDPTKQPVYLEFVKTGTCHNANYYTALRMAPCDKKPFEYNDEEFEAVWLRFVNNTKWALGLETRKSQPRDEEGLMLTEELLVMAANNAAEFDIYYDVRTDTGCIDEGPLIVGCRKREATIIPDNPRPPISGRVFVKPGESLVFAVKRVHLAKYLNVLVSYSFEWEHTDTSIQTIIMPRHTVRFGWFGLRIALEQQASEANF